MRLYDLYESWSGVFQPFLRFYGAPPAKRASRFFLKFQPFLRFYDLGVLAAYLVALCRQLVSTLLEILLSLSYSSRNIQRTDEFQPFLRFYRNCARGTLSKPQHCSAFQPFLRFYRWLRRRHAGGRRWYMFQPFLRFYNNDSQGRLR